MPCTVVRINGPYRAKEPAATENAATKIMPLPTLPRHANRREGKSRDAGRCASSAKNRTRPASPAASSSEERRSAIDTPALAISVTAVASAASGSHGKGGGLLPELPPATAEGPRRTTRLA